MTSRAGVLSIIKVIKYCMLFGVNVRCNGGCKFTTCIYLGTKTCAGIYTCFLFSIKKLRNLFKNHQNLI